MSELKSAALWKRLFATIYDLLILTAVSLLYGAFATLISTLVLGNEAKDFNPNTNGMLVFAGWIAIILFFYCFFWLRVGQTVAMKAWRLKLIHESGDKLTVKTCLLRSVLGVLSLSCFGLGYLWAIVDPDNRTAHDRLTKTRVVQLSKEQA